MPACQLYSICATPNCRLVFRWPQLVCATPSTHSHSKSNFAIKGHKSVPKRGHWLCFGFFKIYCILKLNYNIPTSKLVITFYSLQLIVLFCLAIFINYDHFIFTSIAKVFNHKQIIDDNSTFFFFCLIKGSLVLLFVEIRKISSKIINKLSNF